jgi:hypothetical protein
MADELFSNPYFGYPHLATSARTLVNWVDADRRDSTPRLATANGLALDILLTLIFANGSAAGWYGY